LASVLAGGRVDRNDAKGRQRRPPVIDNFCARILGTYNFEKYASGIFYIEDHGFAGVF
jgi:hypothetical protein